MEPSAGAPYEPGVAASQWGNWRARASGVSRGTRRDRQWLGTGDPEIIYPTKGQSVQNQTALGLTEAHTSASSLSASLTEVSVNMCAVASWRYADPVLVVLVRPSARAGSQRRPTKMRIPIIRPNGIITPSAAIVPAVKPMTFRHA